MDAINQQLDHIVVNPDEEKFLDNDLDVALEIADNIDNLECTATGFGTSLRVHSILVTKRKQSETVRDEEHVSNPPTKRKWRRSLPPEIVKTAIPDYFHGF